MITVDVYEYKDPDDNSDPGFKEISVEGSGQKIAIDYRAKRVKLKDDAGGYYYFDGMKEVHKLRAMLDKLIELAPPIRGV